MTKGSLSHPQDSSSKVGLMTLLIQGTIMAGIATLMSSIKLSSTIAKTVSLYG